MHVYNILVIAHLYVTLITFIGSIYTIYQLLSIFAPLFSEMEQFKEIWETGKKLG